MEYFISIGNSCPCAFAIKNANLRLASYPFDWVLLDQEKLTSILDNNFADFLNRKLYNHKDKICTKQKCVESCNHDIYGDFFRHHCPLCFDEHYNYLCRCVNRFRAVINNTENKINFVYMNNNANIQLLLETLEKHVKANWKLIVIECYEKSPTRYCKIVTLSQKFDHYQVFGMSYNIGVRYYDKTDNEVIKKILNSYSNKKIISENEHNNLWPYRYWNRKTKRCSCF
jgi:hypothetical protein